MVAILNSAILDSASGILDSDTLLSSLRFTQKHSHSTLTLTQTNSIWLKLIHSHSTWWWWPCWILPSWIQLLASWVQTPCYLLSESLKNTLTPLWLWLKLIQSDSNSFILTQLDDVSHLEFCLLEFGHLGFRNLSFSSQTHPYLPRLVPTICTEKKLDSHFPPHHLHKKFILLTQLHDVRHQFCHLGFSYCHDGFSLIFLQLRNLPSVTWKLSCHSLMAAILNSAMLIQTILNNGIQTPCFLLSDSLKTTLPPLWLWLKLIQSDWNSFILTQLDDGSHLEFCHLGFSFCHVGIRLLFFFPQIHSNALSLHSVSDSNSFIFTYLDDGGHLQFCHLEFHHLGFSHHSLSSQTHSYLPRLVPTICTKKTSLTLPSPPFAQKTLIHSFWLNLMMAAILNSAMLVSDTAILDSDTWLSSLRFTQKHTPSTLTLTQTNSIWFKLIHSHLTWWWWPSWILPSWILPT